MPPVGGGTRRPTDREGGLFRLARGGGPAERELSPDTMSTSFTSSQQRPLQHPASYSASPTRRRVPYVEERHIHREHEMDTERRSVAPPIVRTTVEGNLKMEKSVGTHLRQIDHQ